MIVFLTVIQFFIKVSAECHHGEVQLVNSSVSNEGRVEVCIRNNWSSVCATGGSWGNDDAEVVCRQLGYTPAGELIEQIYNHYYYDINVLQTIYS